MSELKQLEIEWDGNPLKIYLTNKPERLSEESFEQYKARRWIIQKLEKKRLKGIPVEFGTPTKAGMNKKVNKSIQAAEKLDRENYERNNSRK